MLISPDALFVLALALAIDAVTGDPDRIWRRYPHPVVWFGKAITWLDLRCNRETAGFMVRRTVGIVSLVGILILFAGSAWLMQRALMLLPLGWMVEALLASVLLAQRSLHDHVIRVARALATDGLEGGRKAVSMIVGRDPLSLDSSGVARAAIESTAENFSDGVVAPAFWFAVAGLPGLVAYKVVNTADSMIGHRNERHHAYGWAAARLDDGMNLLPARLSGILLACCAPLVSGSSLKSLSVMGRDAGLHRSPNAGWPEAAMAGALGLALAGPRRYGASILDDAFLNAEARRDANASDIIRALRVMIGACVALFTLVVTLGLLSASGLWR
ncbi:MAG: adenosylcobinamide-phosphate synthase CbiB [Beijerinckiaceae bacterium]